MDLRERKTRRSITGAFLQMRRHKPLEKITVKELAELAEISKATFYLHYRDIYDLSDALQNEVIKKILAGIEHPEYFMTDAGEFTRELFQGFYDQQEVVDVLFSGKQFSVLPMRIDQELRAYIHERFPHTDHRMDMLLTYQIQGSYHVYQTYCREYGMEKTFDFLAEIAGRISHLRDGWL